MENRAHALAAGLFAIALGIATLIAVWWFSSTHEAEVEYDLVTTGNVTGLNPQATVRYRGMSAGKVISIRIDPDDSRNILVRINVSADIPVNNATYASLGYQGVTGLAFVQLDERGEDRRPLTVTQGDVARIPLEPGLLDQLTDTALDAVHRFRSIADQVSGFFDDDNLDRFRAALASLEQAATGIEQTFDEVPQTLRAAREFFSEQNIERVSATLGNLERASGNVEPVMAEMRILMERSTDVMGTIEEVASSAGDSLLDGTMPRLNRLLGELTETSVRMGRLIDDIEASPQLLLTGRRDQRPGPGEPGFNQRNDAVSRE